MKCSDWRKRLEFHLFGSEEAQGRVQEHIRSKWRKYNRVQVVLLFLQFKDDLSNLETYPRTSYPFRRETSKTLNILRIEQSFWLWVLINASRMLLIVIGIL